MQQIIQIYSNNCSQKLFNGNFCASYLIYCLYLLRAYSSHVFMALYYVYVSIRIMQNLIEINCKFQMRVVFIWFLFSNSRIFLRLLLLYKYFTNKDKKPPWIVICSIGWFVVLLDSKNSCAFRMLEL